MSIGHCSTLPCFRRYTTTFILGVINGNVFNWKGDSNGKGDSPRLNWEYLKSNGGPTIITYRAKVFGGWLSSMEMRQAGGMSFLHAPLHEWDGTSL